MIKRVIITGGTGLLGKELVSRLSADNYEVITTTSRIEKISQSIHSKHNAIIKHVNFLNDLQIENFENFIKSVGKIDFLINNAGAAWAEPFGAFSEGGWDKVMNLNVKSIFFLTQELAPLLKVKGTSDDPSRVINIGSIDGINVAAFETYSYGASKAAVHHLTRQLAKRLINENILVNAIAPGPFPSNMLGAAVAHDYTEIAKRNPRKRVGTPEDMAGLAIFLCSRAGAYTVGETITCDGGIARLSGHDLG